MYLGIDLGTSEVKVLLLSPDGAVVGTAGTPFTVARAHPRWAEQHPDDWWAGTLAALAALRARHPQAFAAVRGIGLSGQMHGAVLLDSGDRVLRPAILWNDMRSADECALLEARAPELHAIAGNLAMPGFTAPKLLWVARHEPDVFGRIACVLMPKDYLRLKLTGEKVSDPSDAAGTLWLDAARRDWSGALLAAGGMTRAQMPRIVEGNAPSGTLRADVARALGLAESVVVAGGGGDNATSALGIGATQPGDGFVSLGTSGVLSVVGDRFRPNPASAVHAFCHAIPERWQQMSVVLSAASCLRWVCKLTSTDEPALLAEIAALDPAVRENAPLFLPYLSGERTPHNDPYAQGVFFGMTHGTERALLGYAVLEGVTLALADGFDALIAGGTQTDALSLIGGGARSAYWAQLIADALGVRTRRHGGGETGAALGAARLGWLAVGGAPRDVLAKPPLRDEFAPDAARHAALRARLDAFRALYRHVRPLFEPSRARLA
ncbi:xylulokinase [Burkholderia pseudomallei MSHR4377]|uniref:xylulokinase n=1 Tax=Burkholderia pseudomallei TaxID=28450 RepID=UPI00050FFA0F|nr:xylulokinase [Burkholderia pseudomallei]APY98079.1 xylulokinase [Burkholderia pseudomallei]APZ11662.1 xylulokinase [Burkholderia pseudomallei]KGC41761.1 xylulokinase [Burkholderia pseudomallei]KGS66040.1 xylulokinase [Burkholderia pseudomallei MSHR4868]KGU94629.1 xylulokinase [Burkholderia pseudomallei MSHR4377]